MDSFLKLAYSLFTYSHIAMKESQFKEDFKKIYENSRDIYDYTTVALSTLTAASETTDLYKKSICRGIRT